MRSRVESTSQNVPLIRTQKRTGIPGSAWRKPPTNAVALVSSAQYGRTTKLSLSPSISSACSFRSASIDGSSSFGWAAFHIPQSDNVLSANRCTLLSSGISEVLDRRILRGREDGEIDVLTGPRAVRAAHNKLEDPVHNGLGETRAAEGALRLATQDRRKKVQHSLLQARRGR